MTRTEMLVLVIVLFWASIAAFISLAAWTLNKHVPRRSVGQIRGLTVPVYRNETTHEIGQTPEPLTTYMWPVEDVL